MRVKKRQYTIFNKKSESRLENNTSIAIMLYLREKNARAALYGGREDLRKYSIFTLFSGCNPDKGIPVLKGWSVHCFPSAHPGGLMGKTASLSFVGSEFESMQNECEFYLLVTFTI